MKKRFLLASCWVIFFQMVYGQEIRLYTGNPFITLDDQLQLIMIVTGEPLYSPPEFPEVDGFIKVSPNVQAHTRGQGQEMHYTQAYFPQKTGRFTIPSFEVPTPSGVHRTRKLFVEVEQPSVRYRYEDLPVDVTLHITLNKPQGYVGEQIVAEIRAFFPSPSHPTIRFLPVSIEDIVEQLNLPDLHIEGVSLPTSDTLNKQNPAEGELLARLYLFPLKTGSYTLNSILLRAERQQIARNASPNDRRKGLHIQSREALFSVSPVTFEVHPLPKTQLKKAYATGSFSLVQEVPLKEYKTGESIRLELSLTGTGYANWVSKPIIHEDEKLIFFEPVIHTSREWSDTGLVSRKVFTYEVIPAYPGNYNLGPVLFYYFNAQKQVYDSLEIVSIPVNVSGEDIPQLMEVSELNHFYDYAFERAEIKPVSDSPYIPVLVVIFLSLGAVSLAFAVRKWL